MLIRFSKIVEIKTGAFHKEESKQNASVFTKEEEEENFQHEKFWILSSVCYIHGAD